MDEHRTLADSWYDSLERQGADKSCILYEDKSFTFGQVEDLSNKVGHFLLSKGLKKDDTVAFIMENRPEYCYCWLAFAKTGIRGALINTSIKSKGLLHCIQICEAKMVLFGEELASGVRDIESQLCTDVQIEQYDSQTINNISSLEKISRCTMTSDDVFGYIYTSGTTGLPKAAVITHRRMIGFGMLTSLCFGVTEEDIIYCTLPLFHSSGGGLGLGSMICTGSTIVLKKRFSASEFWADCVKYNATVIQYIGELCRYLLLQPKSADEILHKVRIAIGNGLRPEIWDEFQDRFNIPEIGEFYGSTEGIGGCFNHCTTKEARGFCGYMPVELMKLRGFRIVQFDVLNEEPVRNSNGFCIDAAPGAPGEFLCQINEGVAFQRFSGYRDKHATEKKIMRDVFEKGDAYFRTGDLLSVNEEGYFRFVDRIGDTFRWKGENCSTGEVTEVLAVFPGIAEVNVYGVQIPGNLDGRAPMAAITPLNNDLSNVDLEKFYDHAKRNLPSYAVPIFIRVLRAMEVTATMKHQKVKLRNEGINLELIADDLLWLNPDTKRYEKFGLNAYNRLVDPRAKL